MARQVNKHLGRKDLSDYEFISGHGRTNTYMLIAKDTVKDLSVETAYGSLVRAMIDGKPVVFDEVNAVDEDVMKAINKILQLKAGDTYQLQEDGGEKLL